MSDPVNLNRFRKVREKQKKKETANRNARKFGRSKAERMLEATRGEKAARMLDGHYMDDDE